jgi:hypothetical protein
MGKNGKKTLVVTSDKQEKLHKDMYRYGANLTQEQVEKHFRKKAFAPYVNLTQEQVEKLAKNKKNNRKQ